MTQHPRNEPQAEKGGDDSKRELQAGDLAVFDAHALFGDAREIGIQHDGSLYRLRITRQGKLILNK